MSVLDTCIKILKKCSEIMKEDGFTDKDVKETFEYAQKVTNKSHVSDNAKNIILNALEKAKKDSEK